MIETITSQTVKPETSQLLTDLFGTWNGEFPKPGLANLVELPEYKAILLRFKEARDKGETLHLKGFNSNSSGERVELGLEFQPETFHFGYIVKVGYTSEVRFIKGKPQKVMRRLQSSRIYDVIAVGKFDNGTARAVSLSDLLPLGHEQRVDPDLDYPHEFLQIVENPELVQV